MVNLALLTYLMLQFAIASPTPVDLLSFLETRHSLPELAQRDGEDPCAELYKAPNGQPRYDCSKKNSMKDGHCPVDKKWDKDTQCRSYCEIRRRAFLGEETTVAGPGSGSGHFAMGQTAELQEGFEVSVEKSVGVNLGAQGGLDAVFAAGVSFSYTSGVTTTKSITLSQDPSPDYYMSWMAFPIYIETCGTLTEKETTAQSSGKDNDIKRCTGDPKNTDNVCSTVPYTGNGKEQRTPKVMYAVRYEDKNGNAVDMDKQSDAYRWICIDFKEGKCKAKVPPGMPTDISGDPKQAATIG